MEEIETQDEDEELSLHELVLSMLRVIDKKGYPTKEVESVLKPYKKQNRSNEDLAFFITVKIVEKYEDDPLKLGLIIQDLKDFT